MLLLIVVVQFTSPLRDRRMAIGEFKPQFAGQS